MSDTRPWSSMEIAERIPRLVERIEQGVLELKALGEEAVRAKWTYERHLAQAILVAEERNAERRKAAAMMTVVNEDGMTVMRHGFIADLAERRYKDQSAVLRALDTELRVCQSLMVSARQVG